jgi:hypothetical protein
MYINSALTTKDLATVRHLLNTIQIEIAKAAAYSRAGQIENATGCLERAENCNDRIYCIETGEPDTDTL